MKAFQQHHIARICAALLAALSTLCWAGEPELDDEPLARLKTLSIEELMNLEVTSVSKKEEKFSETAAALYVITQEDLRRSGATSIAEALRMVPGVHVARVDSSNWAVSCRGFNSRFANKLLVLVDGRSVYTSLFAGVIWEHEDMVLEDIERIEVIRGPGSTLWGANAVNGVINIITKSAKETQGGLLKAGGGTEERAFSTFRYGGKLSDDAYYRIYAKYFDRDAFVDASGDSANDDWSAHRTGFRIDWDVSDRDSLMLQGDYFEMDLSQTLTHPILVEPYIAVTPDSADARRGHLLLRWQRTLSDESDLALQLYYDWGKSDELYVEYACETTDLDFQHRLPLGERHEIVWGMGYRRTSDETTGTFIMSLDPLSRTIDLFSAFIQDEITLTQDVLSLIVGSKFEHNGYTGFEYQPSARLVWTPSPRRTVWTAVSRAVRTPARIDQDLWLTGPPLAAGVYPRVMGHKDFESEHLLAYELGYRVQPSDQVTLDVVAFYHDYDDLRTAEPGLPFVEASPEPAHLVMPFVAANKMDGEAYGVELATNWQAADWWLIRGGYTFLDIQLHLDSDSRDTLEIPAEEENPQNIAFIRSSMDLPGHVTLDIGLRYVDTLPALDVDRYLDMDARLAWNPTEDLEVFIVGQNLLDSQHPEFTPKYLATRPTEVQRGVYAGVTWRF